jgi:hypothetical protein
MQIYKVEEKFWRERFSEKWLFHGDSMSYFNKIANGRKK